MTVGYGDVTPTTDGEQLFTVYIMIVGAAFELMNGLWSVSFHECVDELDRSDVELLARDTWKVQVGELPTFDGAMKRPFGEGYLRFRHDLARIPGPFFFVFAIAGGFESLSEETHAGLVALDVLVFRE